MYGRTLVRLFSVVVFCGLSWGQVTTATLSGRVLDSSSGVVPAAIVTIRNTDTGIERTIATDESGHYTATNLSLGSYEISVSMPGFRTEIHRGLTLSVGQKAVLDLVLSVGEVTDTIDVTTQASLIETTNAVVGGLVDEKQLQNLPINARSLIALGPLQAGVAFTPTAEASASKGMATKLTISGTRYNSNLFQLDGLDVNDTAGSAGSATGNLMGAEAVQEFNIVINGYSAEYGKHSGGVFNAVTKSGTNSLHGTLFEFLRNDNLDAARWEDNRTGQPKPEFKRNQFGASLGGPLVRDRSFFFGSYEALRERVGRSRTTNVPTEALRRGELRDPGTGIVRLIPIDPEVKPFLDFYPLPSPNGRISSDGTQERFDLINLPSREDYFTTKVDHHISDKDSLFGRYTFDDANKTVTVGLAATNFNVSRSQSAALGWTHIFSPTLINQLLLGFSRNNISDDNAERLKDVQLPAKYQFGPWPGEIGGFSVPSLTNIAQAPARVYINNAFQLKDDIFYTKGRHSLKFGFNAQRMQYNHAEYTFHGSFTFATMEDFLRGIANSFNGLLPGSNPWNYIRNSLYGLYVQDDYRLSPTLSLNLGLRYEFITTPFEKYGRVSNLADFVTPGQTPEKLILGNPTFLNPSLKNFAPRIGLAWDPTGTGKTSIRAGAGIFHNQINPGEFMYGFLASPPYYVVGNISQRGLARFPDAMYVQQNIMTASRDIEGFQYDAGQPTAYKWSLEIQKALGGNTSVNVGYSGTRGVHLIRYVMANSRIAQVRDGRLFIPNNAPFPNPGFGRMRPRFTDVTSDYHGFLLTVKRRLSAGLQFQGSYTWSKTIDDGSNWTGSSDWGNSGGPRYQAMKDRGLSAFDVRNTFVTNFTYQLPGARVAGIPGVILRAWQVSGIVSLRGGNPFNVSTGISPSHFRNGFISDFPDSVADAKIQYDTRNSDRYFDPSAFRLPPGYTSQEQASLGGAYVGNTGRSILIGPGSATVDLVLQKEFVVTERAKLQFRSEFFNLLNRANFALPNGRIFASATGTLPNGSPGTLFSDVGRITSTVGTARQIQFGLRLSF
jgi:hypothetical protein